MQRPIPLTLQLLLAAVLALSLPSALAQEPAPDPPAEASEAGEEAPSSGRPNRDRRRPPTEVVRFMDDVTIEEGETVGGLVLFGGDATVLGMVDGDTVNFGGAFHLGPQAEVDGDLVVVAGRLEVQEGAVVDGDVVVLGEADAPASFQPTGDLVTIGTPGGSVAAQTAISWFTRGPLMGRLIVPDLPWVWIVVAWVWLLYFALNFLFERPVRRCADFLAEKPLMAVLVGMLVAVLAVPATVMLTMTVVGIPLIPFLWTGIAVAGVFGRVATARWLGGRVVAEPDTDGPRAMAAARALGIGLGLVALAYMVPLVGMTVCAVLGVLGIGAVTAVTAQSFSSEGSSRGRATKAVVSVGPFEAAGVLSRFGAVALDLVLFLIIVALTDATFRWAVIMFIVYHAGMWAWRSTTVGGLICQVRVVKPGGASLDAKDAVARALSAVFSVVPLGLGWLWSLWDARGQAWHDKIARTYVVRVASDEEAPFVPTDSPTEPDSAIEATDAQTNAVANPPSDSGA